MTEIGYEIDIADPDKIRDIFFFKENMEHSVLAKCVMRWNRQTNIMATKQVFKIQTFFLFVFLSLWGKMTSGKEHNQYITMHTMQ